MWSRQGDLYSEVLKWKKDLGKIPHLLVAGATGSGKSIETKVILAQAILRDYFAIIADYKYVEYSSVWAASAHIVHDDDNLLWLGTSE